MVDLIEADLVEVEDARHAMTSGSKNGAIDSKVSRAPADDSLASNLNYALSHPFLRTLVTGLHDGPISMMDVAQELPLIATASRRDRSVRVWNYLERDCEMVKVFEEEEAPLR